MTIETNLHGRLRNTSLPYSQGLLPVFEAVVNSIQAIEEVPSTQGEIDLEILREQTLLDTDLERPGEIVGFKIQDNGIGFTDQNLTSFQTLDSEYKIEKGGRGVGRLMWLKAFHRAHVSSTFLGSDAEFYHRAFDLTAANGVSEIETTVAGEATARRTIVTLEGFGAKYDVPQVLRSPA